MNLQEQLKETFDLVKSWQDQTVEEQGRLQKEIHTLQERIEGMEAAAERPTRAANDPEYESKDDREYRSVFCEWLRSPRDDGRKHRLSEAQREILTKDVSIGDNAAGGFALPKQIDAAIERRVRQLNPFRQLVKVQQIGTNDYHHLVSMNDASSGWVGENDNRSGTDSPTLRDRQPTMGELYAYPTASNWSLDDLFFDVQEWLVESVAEEFAAREATAIVDGNGTNKPTGFLNGATVATDDDASPMRDASVLEFIAAPVSPVAVDYTGLVQLVHALKEAYLVGEGVAFVMNRAVLSQVRQLVDTTGRPIWLDNTAMGVPPTLLGFPVFTTDAMPAYAGGNDIVAFGNWRRGYLLADRVGTRIIVDNITAPGFTKFYVSTRRGGIILNNDAIKTLKLV